MPKHAPKPHKIMRRKFAGGFRLSMRYDPNSGTYWVVFHQRWARKPTHTKDAHWERCEDEDDAQGYFDALIHQRHDD